jgi:hypothetical protein
VLITNVKLYGLEESIYASGYPMLSKPPTEKEFESGVSDVAADIFMRGTVEAGAHVRRALKLGSTAAGTGHNNFLKGIIVQMDVNAPQYWWQQAQRYHWFDFVSSMSKVHCLTKMDIDKMCDTTVTETAKLNLVGAIQDYTEGKIDFDTMMCNVPMGLHLTARMTTNYLQLKTMYAQRQHHKSREWQRFCKCVTKLPMSYLITGGTAQ